MEEEEEEMDADSLGPGTVKPTVSRVMPRTRNVVASITNSTPHISPIRTTTKLTDLARLHQSEMVQAEELCMHLQPVGPHIMPGVAQHLTRLHAMDIKDVCHCQVEEL